MGNIVINQSLGRVVELYNRVDTNDPAASELVIMILATAGIESDAVLKDKVTFADMVSGTTNEVTNAGYAKKVLGDVDIVAFAPDQVNDRTDLDVPDQTFTAIAAGDGWNDLVTGFDPVGAQTMTDIIPNTLHDFVVTPDGSDIVASFPNGYYRAS